jgi:hypothetical protein
MMRRAIMAVAARATRRPAATRAHASASADPRGGSPADGTRAAMAAADAVAERLVDPSCVRNYVNDAMFAEAASELFDSVKDDAAAAAGAVATEAPGVLELAPAAPAAAGQVIRLEICRSDHTVRMASVSGDWEYRWSPLTREWRSVAFGGARGGCGASPHGGGHELRDALLRDLLSMARGAAGKRY